jgi:hypothetical protein
VNGCALGWKPKPLAGIMRLGDFGGTYMADNTAEVLVAAGPLLAAVATTALLGQRWLLVAPLRARDQDELITADVVLAMGLRDLLAATLAMSMTATFMTLFAPDRAWWLVAMFGGASLISISAIIGVRRRRSLLPVARRLSLGSPAP